MESESQYYSDYISAPLMSWSVEDKKKFIIKNYLPNLSGYQKIDKRFTNIDINKKKEEQKFELIPNMNFKKDGKDYFIFYNDNLGTLKEIYKLKLKSLINANQWTINYYKINLLNSIDSNEFNITDENGLTKKWIDYILSWILSNTAYKESIDLGEKLSLINSIIKRCSNNINTDNVAYITITQDLENISVTYIPDKNYKGYNYINHHFFFLPKNFF